MNETDNLRGLISKARRDRDKSIRQLAFEAQAAGHKIVGTTLSAIEKGTYKSAPSIETIRAIGWLAGVNDDVSFAAAGRTPPGLPFAEELPPGIDDLSPKERRAAIEVLRALIAQRQEINRYEYAADSSPQPRAPGETGEDQKNNVRALNQRDQAPDIDVPVRQGGRAEHFVVAAASIRNGNVELFELPPVQAATESEAVELLAAWATEHGYKVKTDVAAANDVRFDMVWTTPDVQIVVEMKRDNLAAAITQLLWHAQDYANSQVDYGLAARYIPGKSPGEMEYEQHAAAGEESQADPTEES